jgi:hypothetical protein
MRLPRPTERQEQAHIAALLRSLGAYVLTLGTTRKRGDYHGTMQTPGLPDVICFLPAKLGHEAKQLLFIEVKAPTGRLRPEQITFLEQCHDAGIPHIVGGLDTVFRWLVDQGYLRENQFGHYHAHA